MRMTLQEWLYYAFMTPSRYGPIADGFLVLFCALIAINCILGLIRRDGMYNRRSTRIMVWAQILGIIWGFATIAWEVTVYYFWYVYPESQWNPSFFF